GTYGTFAINATSGAWTYALNNALASTQGLAEGTSAVETFTATVTDDKGAVATEQVTVTITGTNDSPTITTAVGQNAGALTEAGKLDGGTVVPGTPSAGGTLTSSDGDTGAPAARSCNVAGTYGTFAISAGGAWTYTLNNALASTQGLA